MRTNHESLLGLAPLLLVALAGCHGGGSGAPAGVGYTIGGIASGLSGTGLVLQDNGGDNLAVTGSGSFTFRTSVAGGGPYAVSVLSQPTNPAQVCAVSQGSGTVTTHNITDVAVSCVSQPPAATIASIVVSGGALILPIGGTGVLTAQALDANGATVPADFAWQTSDSTVATVSGGRVSGFAIGQVQITAASNGVTSAPATAFVNVSAGSSELLSAAVTSGQISTDQALVYQIWALFGDSRLPLQYRPTVKEEFLDDLIMREAAARFDSLTTDLQHAIGPYFVPPAYVTEITPATSAIKSSNRHPSSDSGPGTDSRPGGCMGTLIDYWASVPTAHFRIWYDTQSFIPQMQTVDVVAQVGLWAEAAYDMLVTQHHFREPIDDTNSVNPNGTKWLCDGGDNKLDIYLKNNDFTDSNGQTIGVAAMTVPTLKIFPSPVFILMPINTIMDALNADAASPASLPGTKTLRNEIAHEFMHAVQSAYANQETPSYFWTADATAVWAQDLVYPADNTEQDRAISFMLRADKPLFYPNQYCVAGRVCAGGENDALKMYGAYLLFQYLSRTTNATDVISEFFLAAETGVDSLQALDTTLNAAGLGGFQQVWPQFALSLWNPQPAIPPATTFFDMDALTLTPRTDPSDPRYPVQTTYDHQMITLGGDAARVLDLPTMHSAPVNISELSIVYDDIEFDTDVRSLVFYNGYTRRLAPKTLVIVDKEQQTQQGGQFYAAYDVPGDMIKGRGLWALKKINNAWTSEDWTQLPVGAVCLDITAQRLQELVLVFSNGNFTSARGDAFEDNAAGPLGAMGSKIVVSKTPCYKYKGKAASDLTYADAQDNFHITTALTASFKGAGDPEYANLGDGNATVFKGWKFVYDDPTVALATSINGTVRTCDTVTPLAGSFTAGASWFQKPLAFTIYTVPPGQAAFNAYVDNYDEGFRWTLPNCHGSTEKLFPALNVMDFSLDFTQLLYVEPQTGVLSSGAAGLDGPVDDDGDYSNPGRQKNNWCFAPIRQKDDGTDDGPSPPCP